MGLSLSDWGMGFTMKLLLSVGAIALTLTSSAHAQAAERDQQRLQLPEFMALFPDAVFGECFERLRLESLSIDPETQGVRVNLKSTAPPRAHCAR